MGKNKILYITQELNPYTNLTNVSQMMAALPKQASDEGYEVRVLMPRFGVINERRHRLHEVVRLSGMNIIVNNDDYPLIIKVASLPGSRLQVYFLDNEEFFKRKFLFENAEDQPFDDNLERMVFFCKGVLETVKKFGWPPDIIHCHGWMTSLVPQYLNTAYKHEPIFEHSAVIYSAYESPYEHLFKNDFAEKASINYIEESVMDVFLDDGNVNLNKGAILNSDGVIVGSENMDEIVTNLTKEKKIPTLEYVDKDAAKQEYMNFYKNFIKETE